MLCLLCGEPLPKPPWWARFTGTAPPMHTTRGAQGEACWIAMNARIGVLDPGPKPR